MPDGTVGAAQARIVLFDGSFREAVDKRTRPIGRFLVRCHVSADLLTVAGIILSVGCAVAVATGHFWLGAGLLLASALPDLLDGPVAKASGTQSLRGEFFDSVADRITDSLVLGGLAWYFLATSHPKQAIVPVGLLGASQLISYQRAKAEIHGFNAKGGLMERAERVVALLVGLVFNQILLPVLGLILALTLVTAVQRFVKVWKQATEASPALAARRRETPPFVRNLFEAWTDADENRRRKWREWADQQRQERRRTRSNRPR